MPNKGKSILITGASGFIGRYLVEIYKEKYKIFAIARRSIEESNIAYHHNIHWLQCDITNKERLKEVAEYILNHGGISYVIHLAAYYDFDYKDRPEYDLTNIKGTEYILEMAKRLKPKRFLYASSLAACNFPKKGKIINEKTEPDADFAYARSKKEGEKLCRQYSKYFPCSVLRFAAVFSDWCEYAPLYQFLSTWLSGNWKSNILGGKGKSAITYIYLYDLYNLIDKVFTHSGNLKNYDVYNVSPDGCVSHKELYNIASRDYFGSTSKPFFMPKPIAYFGLLSLIILSKIRLMPKPFERLWMMKYVDLQLEVDSSYTRKTLGWKPTPRYHIKRRLLFLLVNMKSHTNNWHILNEAAMKHAASRVNLIIYDYLVENKEVLLTKINNQILSKFKTNLYPNFQKMSLIDFKAYTNSIYNLILASVRTGDRSLILKHIDEMALNRYSSGFKASEICGVLSDFQNILLLELLFKKDFQKMKQEIHDYISLSIQLAQDEIEDIYESIGRTISYKNLLSTQELDAFVQRKEMMKVLSDFYRNNPY